MTSSAVSALRPLNGDWSSFEMYAYEVLGIERVGEFLMLRPPQATRYHLYEVVEYTATNEKIRVELCPAWEHEVI